MDSILRFASGLSTTESFARDVYIKSNLTIELDRVVKQIVQENDIKSKCENKYLCETPTISSLCDIIEAIFLHGLKEKLSSRVSSVFGGHSQPKSSFSLEYWPMIQVLCHTEETKHLKQLDNIYSSIGRCRAWLRSSFNESLFRSYLIMLINDSSILNGFYRSSAYLRDTQHTEMMQNIILDLDNYVFQLSIDNLELNYWNNCTLNYIGVHIYDEDSTLVVTALDAIHLISEDNQREDNLIEENIVNEEFDFDQCKTSSPIVINEVTTPIENDDSNSKCASISLLNYKNSESEISVNYLNDSDDKENVSHCSGNSLSVKSTWSTQPIIQDESYSAILESYSNRAVLSSTPDINDVRCSISSQMSVAKSLQTEKSNRKHSSDLVEFEIIPKNAVTNSEGNDKSFIEDLSKLAQEYGLDEQDYKCNACSRPIGMIYGKFNVCRIDGHLYCPECHCDEESIIPAQIIFNWNFKKFPVAKHNKRLMLSIESEPIFDIKMLSPFLYSVIPEMEEILDLRTQLFFLHAYLFTCRENIAMKMRKMVWPREHLFEHIHLYSINDILQVYYNTLAPILRQVISFARKHISGCDLCKLKGYYCEICKDSQILYPFDTNSTRRCESCKSVFHVKCFDEKYDKNSCRKCIQSAKWKEQQMEC